MVAVTFSACDNYEDVTSAIPMPSDVEIVPQARVTATRSAFTGIQDSTVFPMSTDSVFAVSAFLSKENQDSPYFLSQPIKSDSEGNYSFYTENGFRYFPEDQSPVYFYAYSPLCGIESADNESITWNLTGQEDIMYAKDLSGLHKLHGDSVTTQQPQPDFKFAHKLIRFNIFEFWGGGFADKIVISEIRIKNCVSKVTLSLSNGDIEVDATKTTDFFVTLNHEIAELSKEKKNAHLYVLQPAHQMNIEKSRYKSQQQV